MAVANPKRTAVLVLIVEYDEMPELSDLQDSVNELNGAGRVVKAELTVTKDTIMDLRP